MCRSRIVQGRGPEVQKIFLEDVMSLKSAIGEYGNPFLKPCSSDLLVLDTRDVVEKCVVDNVYRIKSLGCQQYDNLYGNGNSRVQTIFLKS